MFISLIMIASLLSTAPIDQTATNTLVIVGDSVLYVSRDVFPVGVIDAQFGRSAYMWDQEDIDEWNADPIPGDPGSGMTAVDKWIPTIAVGGWLVVELGTNDAQFIGEVDWALETDPTEFGNFVDYVVQQLPDDRCLGWVTPYSKVSVERSIIIEQEIRDHIRTQPCHVVIEWAAEVRENPWMTPDDVHPDAVGSIVFASMIYQAINKGE